MKKVLCATITSAFLFTAVVPNMAFAAAPAPMPIAGGTNAAAGVVATAVIVVAGGFVLYDILRRTTPMPDWAHLGGVDFRMMKMNKMMMEVLPREQINAMPPRYHKAINF